MPFISCADLVALSMTCKKMKKLFDNLVQEGQIEAHFRSEVFKDIFRFSSYSQLVWFQKTLKYLSRDMINDRSNLLLTVRGEFGSFCFE